MVKFHIVSGFLGAGKTSFIKKILNTCATGQEKVVLIENEFGAVDIDSEVLRVAGFDVFAIDRGCVCCTLKGEFAYTLKQILQQKPDRIIFEPSGIFILSEIFSLFKSPGIAETCSLHSVITIVDGVNFPRHKASFSSFFTNQVANASSLVISKTQFLDPGEIEGIRQELSRLNPFAEIVSENWADLSTEKIWLLLDGNVKYVLNNFCYTVNHEQPHIHGFESFGIRTAKNMESKELAHILELLSTGLFGNILRGKGIIQSGTTCLEFSYVDGKFSIVESNSPVAGIVNFIGTGLQRDKLTTTFT